MRSVLKSFMVLRTKGCRRPYSPVSTSTVLASPPALTAADHWTLSVTVPTSTYVLETVLVSVCL